MNTEKRPAENSHELRDGNDGRRNLTLNSRLNVTVIATTREGTTAALGEAHRLAKDLGAHITLLKMEVVPSRFPLEESPVTLDVTTKQLCSLVLQSAAREQDVTVRSCLCRDRDFTLQRILRRRALIVIGGRRHWWLSREERLEKVLRGLGHHVIFTEVGAKKTGPLEVDRPPLLATVPASLAKKWARQNLFWIAKACGEMMPEDAEITRRTSQSAVRRRGGKKTRIQTVDVCESKFQSIPLCVVDARDSTLQSGSSLPKDGVHEA